MIAIANIFKQKEFRFCPIKPLSKQSFTDHNKHNYKFDDPIILSYLNKNYNYGILAGYGFDLLVDIDNNDTYDKIKDLLTNTLTQRSGIKGLPQLFYKAPYIKHGKEYRGYVDFLAKGKYVLGCNSIVKNEKDPNDQNQYTYKLLNDTSITELPEDNYNKIIKIVETIYVLNKPHTKVTKNINPNINWLEGVDQIRYFNNTIEIQNIQLLYKNKDGERQYIFKAYFTDIDKELSFALNKPTEATLIKNMTKGHLDRALFYTILHNGKYMRQIKYV